jgi:hypothetical protein
MSIAGEIWEEENYKLEQEILRLKEEIKRLRAILAEVGRAQELDPK